jgi:[acyl-carrier-protein] S-malonyltransferase
MASSASVPHTPGAAGRLAFVFPGGGSQHVGMGRDLYERYPAARRVFEEADQVLGFSLSAMCFEGPEEELSDTLNAQPAMLATSAATLAVLKDCAGDALVADLVAGHSTGQYTALVAAGVLDFASAVRLVRERGRLMSEAGSKVPGAMAAVLGLTSDVVEAICREVGDVWVSNDNGPAQTVISGSKVALGQALRIAKERGARRVILLAVNVAAHSPLMASAAESLARLMSSISFQEARIPVVVNGSAAAVRRPEDLRQELIRHLTSRVRWVESVQRMVACGVSTFVELGPKQVLSGLIRRIDGDVHVLNVGSRADVEAWEVQRWAI